MQSPFNFPDLRNHDIIALDLETYDPNLLTQGPGVFRKDGYICGVALATKTDSYYISLKHPDSENHDKEKVINYLNEQFSSDAIKIGANILYDLEWLKSYGVEVKGPIEDVQIAEPLIDENQFSYSLDSIAKKYLNHSKEETKLREIADKLGLLTGLKDEKAIAKKIKSSIYLYPAEYVEEYARIDASLCIEINELQKIELSRYDLNKVYKLECDLLPIILAMRFKGTPVNVSKAFEANEYYKKIEENHLTELLVLSGETTITPWSNDNISEILTKLSIPFNNTDKGNPSITSSFLEQNEHPFCKTLANYRSVNKMRRDFIEGVVLEQNINGRIHTQFHALRREFSGGTVSGRFSSSNPNLQQIPARNPEWKKICRGLFVPEEGCQWAKFDYSQQELRIMLHYAFLSAGGYGNPENKALKAINQYNNNPETDYHQLVADLANITRTQAKNINFGIIYGIGKNKMMKTLGVSKQEAEEIFKKYERELPYVKDLQKSVMDILAKKRTYLKTLYGRRRNFTQFQLNRWKPDKPELVDFTAYNSVQEIMDKYPDAKSWEIKTANTYKGLNSIIQGSAADMTKLAMVNLYRETGIVPHLTIHDELDCSVSSEKEIKQIKEIMEHALPLELPVLVDVTLGESWAG